MKVILTHNVPKLGKDGDVITVADGYARNYLLPRSLAKVADASNMKSLLKRLSVLERKAETIKANAAEMAGKLEGQSITVKAKTGKNSTKLFGTITANDIADAIKQQYKLDVDKRRIALPDPIKTTGEHEVSIHFHQDVDTKLKVVVESLAE
ncbi:MAG: 50S ribosomal protein L9 [bacterium]|jgi:large subunit ribosomal protein L9